MGEQAEIFRRCGLRRTRQREVLYGALAATTAHPTAEELHQMVREREPGISLATVYNTLEALCARGVVQKIAASEGNGPARWDARADEHVHVMLADGRVMDLPEDLSERIVAGLDRRLLDELSARLGVPIERVSVQIVAHAGE